MNRKRLLSSSTVLGAVLAMACTWYVAGAILDQFDSVGDALGDASPAWLLAGLLAAAASIGAAGLAWHSVLVLLDVVAARSRVVLWYFLGEIGKYLPGGVWPMVGRAELARRGGVGAQVAYGSVILSLALLYLTCGLLIVMTLGPAERAGEVSYGDMWVLGFVPLGLLALHPRLLRPLKELAERLSRRQIEVPVPEWSSSLRLLVHYVPCWIFVSIATVCTSRAVGSDAGSLGIAVAALLSWLVGFAIVFVPSGVGVREAVFVAAAAMPSGEAALVAVLARLLFVVADSGGAAVAGLVLGRSFRDRELPGASGAVDSDAHGADESGGH